jgi:carboxymethylenebutenolidase
MTTLTATDGHHLDAYEVQSERAAAAVVIIQEIFGVNAHIRSVVDRYAALGFRAIAPAVFDRVERGVELEYNGDGIDQGRAFAQGLDDATTMLDIAAAVERVAETGPVAVVGYCYGGSMAWLSASAAPAPPIAAAVGYYGGRIPDLLDRAPRVPIMLHFGAQDQGIPLDGVAKVAEQYPDVPIHIYDDADHGFNCDARASYHAASAALAEERTNAFLATHLG